MEIGRVWSQTRPGPVSAARKMPSPAKMRFLMPGTRVIWKLMPEVKRFQIRVVE